ncbi:MAG: nitroreductase [Chloroflexi bacterium]|nr:MAG: nitroreductase [Chloroflexota bacterium]
MDVVDAIRSRKSIRGFKPDPVPKEVLWEILDIARRAPSARNTQPWNITVVTGEVLDKIRKGNTEMLAAGVEPNPDFPRKPYEGIYRQRQVDLAIQLFKLMGIAREDKVKRAEWIERGSRFFDAPAVIILSIDSSLDKPLSLLDIGAFMQTICLAALNYGLGTCINNRGVAFPEVVRKYAHIPESRLIVTCIAIGYPDWDFPANKLETEREPLENIVTWHGYA